MSHLDDVNETYWEHMKCAMSFARTFFLLGAICAIHAIVPEAFKTTASQRVEKLLCEMRREDV